MGFSGKKTARQPGHRGVIIVTRRGDVRIVSGRAARWMKELATLHDAPLRKALAFWAEHGPDAPYCWEANGRRILVSVADHTRKGSRCLILEQCSPPPALTPQEAAVLRWVHDGKTNEQIATLLHIKICTVKKHLEHIFNKLGVDNRTAAASFSHPQEALDAGALRRPVRHVGSFPRRKINPQKESYL